MIDVAIRDLPTFNQRTCLVPRVAFLLSLSFILLPVTAFASQTRALCFDAPFTENAWAFVSDQDGPKPQPLTRIDQKSGPISSSKLLSFLRSLKGAWSTPDGIWSKSAKRVQIREKGIETCDVFVDKMDLYALINRDTGFVVYELSPPEKLEFVRLTDLRNVVR